VDAPTQLFYQCELHPAMFGVLNIVDAPTPATTSVVMVGALVVPFLRKDWVINGVAGSPRIYVVIGRTYVFSVGSSGASSLFAIHIQPGNTSPALRFADGSVSGQATTQVVWTVSVSAPSVLYYQSEVDGNGAMYGTIDVLAQEPTTATVPSTTTIAANSTSGVTATAITGTGTTTTTVRAATTASTTTVIVPTTTPPTLAPVQPNNFFVMFLAVPILPSQWAINNLANNPLISVVRGRTYTFNVADPTKLFAIHASPFIAAESARYSGGVSGQATAQLLWTVPTAAPDLLFYQSEVPANAAVFGNISVLNETVFYTARFWSTSAACAGAPFTTVTNPSGTCFVNPYSSQFGFVKYTAVNISFANGGGFSNNVCTTAVAALQDIPLGVCIPIAQLANASFILDYVAATTVFVPTAGSTTPPPIVTTSPTVGTTIVTTSPTVAPTTAAGTPGTFSVLGIDLGILPPQWALNGVAGNPSISLVRGRTYTFNVATPDKLFAIHLNSGNVSQSNRYNVGVSGQATSQLVWTVVASAPDTIFYQSEVPTSALMFGAISVVSETTVVSTTNGATTPAVTTQPAASTTRSGTSNTASSSATTSSTFTGSSTTATPTAAPTSPPPCLMAVCCVLGSRPLPIGFSEFSLVLNTTFATFDCPSFVTLLRRDMQLSVPQQLIVLSVDPGSVLFGGAAPTASVDSFFVLIQQGRQNPALNIVSASGPKGTVTPPATPCCDGPKKKRTVINFYFAGIFSNNGTCSSCGL
jgi:hypothetical protein